MLDKDLRTSIVIPGLAVATWLIAFFLLGGSTTGAMPPDRSAISSASTAIETTVLVADRAAPIDNSYPCRGFWITLKVDTAGDVGHTTSIALAPTYPYTPQISYYDVTNDDLKYAWLMETTWLSETVDFQGGQFSSLQMVPTSPYTPCISYHDSQLETGGVRHACRVNSGWAISPINVGQASGDSGTSLALEPTPPYTPHVSYYNPWDDSDTLHHAYLSGTMWVEEWVEPLLSEAGWWSALALQPTYPYTPHISYYDHAKGDLKYARLEDGTWLSRTVDHEEDVGWWTSLALDTGGSPHISYFDFTNLDVKYARLSDTVWLSEPVDYRGEGGYWHAGTSLELDQADNPHICYHDANNDDLKLAYSNGTTWIIQTVDSEGDVGAYCSLALDPLGCPHISYYDATNGDLKYAHLSEIEVYLPLIMRSYTQALPD